MLLLALLVAATCTQTPSADEVAAHIVERAKRDIDSRVVLTFRKEWMDEDTTDPDGIHLNESKAWSGTGVGVLFRQTLVMRDGKYKTNQKPSLVNLNPQRQFISRYALTVANPCTVEIAGRPHWEVAFRPRTDVELPSGQDEDDLLNRTHGVMYVDAESWFIRQATGVMNTPYSVYIVGKVKYADLWLQQEEVDGIVVTREVVIDVQYSSWGRPHSKRISYRYYDFRLVR